MGPKDRHVIFRGYCKGIIRVSKLHLTSRHPCVLIIFYQWLRWENKPTNRSAEELEYTCLLKRTLTQASHDRGFKTWQTPTTYPECLFWGRKYRWGATFVEMSHGPQHFESNNWQGKGLSHRVQNHNQHRVSRIEPVFFIQTTIRPRCNVIRSPSLRWWNTLYLYHKIPKVCVQRERNRQIGTHFFAVHVLKNNHDLDCVPPIFGLPIHKESTCGSV
jgi:hypothetical protein